MSSFKCLVILAVLGYASAVPFGILDPLGLLHKPESNANAQSSASASSTAIGHQVKLPIIGEIGFQTTINKANAVANANANGAGGGNAGANAVATANANALGGGANAGANAAANAAAQGNNFGYQQQPGLVNQGGYYPQQVYDGPPQYEQVQQYPNQYPGQYPIQQTGNYGGNSNANAQASASANANAGSGVNNYAPKPVVTGGGSYASRPVAPDSVKPTSNGAIYQVGKYPISGCNTPACGSVPSIVVKEPQFTDNNNLVGSSNSGSYGGNYQQKPGVSFGQPSGGTILIPIAVVEEPPKRPHLHPHHHHKLPRPRPIFQQPPPPARPQTIEIVVVEQNKPVRGSGCTQGCGEYQNQPGNNYASNPFLNGAGIVPIGNTGVTKTDTNTIVGSIGGSYVQPTEKAPLELYLKNPYLSGMIFKDFAATTNSNANSAATATANANANAGSTGQQTYTPVAPVAPVAPVSPVVNQPIQVVAPGNYKQPLPQVKPIADVIEPIPVVTAEYKPPQVITPVAPVKTPSYGGAQGSGVSNANADATATGAVGTGYTGNSYGSNQGSYGQSGNTAPSGGNYAPVKIQAPVGGYDNQGSFGGSHGSSAITAAANANAASQTAGHSNQGSYGTNTGNTGNYGSNTGSNANYGQNTGSNGNYGTNTGSSGGYGTNTGSSGSYGSDSEGLIIVDDTKNKDYSNNFGNIFGNSNTNAGSNSNANAIANANSNAGATGTGYHPTSDQGVVRPAQINTGYGGSNGNANSNAASNANANASASSNANANANANSNGFSKGYGGSSASASATATASASAGSHSGFPNFQSKSSAGATATSSSDTHHRLIFSN